MKKNVLLLLVLGFQPLFSMKRVEREKPFQISRLSPEVSFRETLACSVRSASRLVSSPSKITALALLEGRHIGSPVSLAKVNLTASSVSLAGQSPVESVSPCSKSPVSLAEFRAGSELALKPVSMMAGMRSYDSAQPSVFAVSTERSFAWSPFVCSMPASVEVPSAPIMGSDFAKFSRVATSNKPGASLMRRMSSHGFADVEHPEALVSDSEDVKTANAIAAMRKLYFGK